VARQRATTLQNFAFIVHVGYDIGCGRIFTFVSWNLALAAIGRKCEKEHVIGGGGCVEVSRDSARAFVENLTT